MKILEVAVLLGAAMVYGQDLPGQDYALGPESQAQSGVPKGTVTTYELAPGKLGRQTGPQWSASNRGVGAHGRAPLQPIQ